MRLPTLVLPLAATLLLLGCGAPSPTVDMGPPDLVPPADLAMHPRLDLGAGPRVECGPMSCPSGQRCCLPPESNLDGGVACAPACPKGQVGYACNGPGDCGGYPCCFSISGSGKGTVISVAACAETPPDCVPKADYLNQILVTRRCKVDADCTAYAPDTAVKSCCSIVLGGARQRFCANESLAALLKGLTCP